MSLYRHVADRHTLLLLMLDEVASSLEMPPVEADPRRELATAAAGDSLAQRMTRQRSGAYPVIERLMAAGTSADPEEAFAANLQRVLDGVLGSRRRAADGLSEGARCSSC